MNLKKHINFLTVVAFLLSCPLWGQITSIPNPRMVGISIEYAQTHQELTWGLMQRRHLPENSGMLFCYPEETLLSLWMFNTYIDLSVAFIDANHVIREIQEMSAYPQQMNQTYPIKTVQDLSRLSLSDPVASFFLNKKTTAKYPTKYVLEMNKNWFAKNQIKVGDVIFWNPNSPKAAIIQTLDISELISKNSGPSRLQLEQKSPIALWAPNVTDNFQIIFLNPEGSVIKSDLLKGGKYYPYPQKPVISSSAAIKYLIVSPTRR